MQTVNIIPSVNRSTSWRKNNHFRDNFVDIESITYAEDLLLGQLISVIGFQNLINLNQDFLIYAYHNSKI